MLGITTSRALGRDGTLVGYEPYWTETQAVANCQWNHTTYPTKVVECWHGGHRLGYELYRNGHRDGFEPAVTQAWAQSNCNWNRATYPTVDVECLYNGVALLVSPGPSRRAMQGNRCPQ